MRFWLEISSATGTRTGRVDNALYWRHTARLDRAGSFEFAIPAADATATLITNQQRVFCYGLVNGVVTELGAGIIERITTQQRGTNPPVTVVSGDDILRELAIHRTVTGNATAYTDIPGSTVIPDFLIDLATASFFPAAWTLGGEIATDSSVNARFGNESLLGALIGVSKVTGEHFRYGGSRTLTWLGPVGNFAASGVLATSNADPAGLDGVTSTCLITSIEEVLDSYDLATVAIVAGAGGGEVQFSLLPVTEWPVGFEDVTSGTVTMTWTGDAANGIDPDGDTWICRRNSSTLENFTQSTASGYLIRSLVYKNIGPLSNTDADLTTAANFLLQAAYQEMRTRTAPQRTCKLAIAGLETALSVGTTLAVQARAVTEDDSGTKRTYINVERDDLIILETETQIDTAGIRTVGLTVSTADRWPDNNEQAVIDRLTESHTALILPQMSAIQDTVRYEEPIDDDYNAKLRFRLSNYVTVVNQVVLFFWVNPLRSTVKNISGGASSASTSDAEGSHTHTTPDHAHSTVIVDGSAFTLVANANLYTSGGIYYIGHEAGGSSYPVFTKLTGEGGTTSAAGASHSHGMAHTHTSTGVYGVFEESGANTYAYSDLEILVNGSAASGTVTALDDGYMLDLTADLVDSANRPNQSSNIVTVQVKAASMAGKSIRVTAEIERRVTIQSIATV